MVSTDLVESADALPAVEHDPRRGSQSLLPAVIAMAKDPDVNVEKLEALLRMQERLEGRQAEAEFNAAFARLSARLPRIKKTGVLEYPVDKNKPLGEKYKVANFAKWENIDREIRPLLNADGFALSFDTQQRPADGGGLIVTATLLHIAGHSRAASIPVPLDTSGGKNNLQGYGSTLSYGKRYAACAVLNIITEDEDDDGKAGDQITDPSFITDEQITEINALIRETKSDSLKVLAYADRATSVLEMTADQYHKARDMLLRKRDRMARDAQQ